MKVFILYLLTCLIWGSTWLAIKYQINDISIEISLALRFFIAFTFLYLICLFRKIPLKISIKEHAFIALIGILLFALQYRLVYESEKTVTSGLVAVISTSIVFFNLLISRWLLQRPFKAELILGALFGLLGMLLIFYQDIQSSHMSLGIGLAFLACLFASFGSVLSEKLQGQSQLGPFQITLYGMLYAGLFSLIYILISGQDLSITLNKNYLLSLVYLSLFGSVFAFTAFIYLIKALGSNKASYITLFYPIVALIISYLFENYQWSYLTSSGIVLIAIGKIISSLEFKSVSFFKTEKDVVKPSN